MKTITVEDKTWQKLSRLRTDLLARNFTEVLEKLLKIIRKHKLKKDLIK